jgi:hypothetical protein
VTGVARALLVIAPALIAFKIGARHHVWQAPMRQARDVAANVVRQVGSDELGLNYQSSKAGLLFPGKTTWVVNGAQRPPVLLCGTRGNSYRDLSSGNPEEGRCDRTGYTRFDVPGLPDGFQLLLRDGVELPRGSK